LCCLHCGRDDARRSSPSPSARAVGAVHYAVVMLFALLLRCPHTRHLLLLRCCGTWTGLGRSQAGLPMWCLACYTLSVSKCSHKQIIDRCKALFKRRRAQQLLAESSACALTFAAWMSQLMRVYCIHYSL